MRFCPTCANMLLVSSTGSTGFHFFCATCPYVSPITRTVSYQHKLTRKQVDDVLGGADAWKNVDQTEAQCPKCSGARAFFMQIQTRSADEPMTTFYKCVDFTCGHQWKEN